MNTSKLLTVKDVAKYFRVCEVSVRRWEKSGALRSVRIGDSIRFTPEALIDFVAAHEKKETV